MIVLDARIAYAAALPSKKTRDASIHLKALLLSLKTNIHKKNLINKWLSG
ncbi:hypothetical protein IO401_001454 [Campylobacter lari]|nr:hypothetical protein [Campylobacter lari]EJV5920868.1 hypothetical protein [Campylobacter lari]